MTAGFESIGKVIRAHGLKGEVIIEPEVANPYQLESLNLFYIATKRGDVEPYRVEFSKVVEKRNRYTFFVKFVHLTERSHAEKLRNNEVMIPAYDSEFSFLECIEWEVFTEKGIHLGKIIDVMDNPAHELLEVKTPKGVVLIPAVDEYIKEVDMEKEQLVVQGVEVLMEI